MNLEERYAKFKKVFPTSELDLAGWKKLKSWDTPAYTLQRLDMAIFPDCLESISMENSPITVVNFIDTQTKLGYINFMYCHISKFKLPETIKKVTEVHLEGNPLFKFDLGGSVDSVECLELPIEMPTNRVVIGEGMESLTSLTIGSLVGAIILHPDLVALEHLTIENSPQKPIKLQKTMTSLKRFEVSGSVTSLVIPEEINLDCLYVDSNDFKLPRKVNVRELNLIIDNTDAVKVPATLVEGVKKLKISLRKPESVSLPKNIGEVENLFIHAYESALGAIKVSSNIKDLYIRGKSVTLTGDLSNAESIDVGTHEAPIIKPVLGGEKLEELRVHHAQESGPEFKYAESYPELVNVYGKVDQTHLLNISPKMEGDVTKR